MPLTNLWLNLTPGQKGSFSDKRKEIRAAVRVLNPIELLSFGPSGLDYSEVCNVEKRLRSSQAILYLMSGREIRLMNF